jgi:hypothetical protein
MEVVRASRLRIRPVSGTFVVNDALKPSVGGANAWLGLAQPDPGGNWQDESKRYQYWVQADSVGNFSVPHVRPGTTRDPPGRCCNIP